MSVRFEGDEYDLTDFSHPGGTVIRSVFNMNNTDTTVLVHSYHPDMERVRKAIAPYKVGTSKNSDDDKSKYLGPLYAELKRRVHSALRAKSLDPGADVLLRCKMISLILWYLGSFVWLTLSTTPTAALLPAVSVGVSGALVGMNIMHDASHMAVETGSKVGWNYVWQLMSGDIIGLSTIGWRFQHGAQHHAHTDDDKDPDAAFLYPLLRSSDHQPHLFIHYFQPILMFLPTLTLTACFLVHDTFHVITGIYTYEGLRKPAGTRYTKAEWAQFGFSKFCLVVIWTTLWQKGGYQALLLYIVFSSYVLGSIDTPGHFTTHPTLPPINKLPRSIQEGDIIDTWLLAQFHHANSFAPSLNGLFGGLNMQIEHHCFPRLSHRHYPNILRPIFQEFCKEHNFPYNDYSLLGVTAAAAKRFLLLSLPPRETKKSV